MIGNTLWIKNGNANILTGYDDFKRQVRYYVNQMEKRGIIIRVEGKPRYQLEYSFVRRPSIYDDYSK